MSKKQRPSQRGPTVVCLDAMILMNYAKADLIDVLGSLFTPNSVPVCTSAWVYSEEIQKPVGRYPENQRILDAGWLLTAPIADDDVVYVDNVVGAWGGEPGKNRGEAEIVALCTRHGWTGVSDDRQAHNIPSLKGQERPYRPAMIHGASLLACAAAESLIDIEDAWRVHQAVESRYDDPPLLPIDDRYARAFQQPVQAIRARRNALGSPAWPILLTHGPERIIKKAVALCGP
jgi:hypothetical protein